MAQNTFVKKRACTNFDGFKEIGPKRGCTACHSTDRHVPVPDGNPSLDFPLWFDHYRRAGLRGLPRTIFQEGLHASGIELPRAPVDLDIIRMVRQG